MQLDVFTQTENLSKEDYQQIIKDRNLEKEMELYVNRWHFFENRVFEENLYDVPHDALVILGAYGHGVIRNFVFGSKMEKIQSTISNNLLIAGPNYTTIR
jgi:nucleotide-binding universal stress UspA family protein